MPLLEARREQPCPGLGLGRGAWARQQPVPFRSPAAGSFVQDYFKGVIDTPGASEVGHGGRKL